MLFLLFPTRLTAVVVCPEGEFACGNSTQCVPQRYQCDNEEQCDNGADELNCGQSIFIVACLQIATVGDST